jgi:alpha-galactosidase
MTRVFEPIAEIDPRARVYVEGWQSWSPVGVFTEMPRPPDARSAVMGWRTGKPLPERGLQAEGVLAAEEPNGGAQAWFSAEAPSIRVVDGVVSADGPVDELAAGSLADAVAQVGDRLSPGPTARVPPGWCSWYCHFEHVTEADIAAAAATELPFEIIQIDAGWEAGIGDWLESSPRFGDIAEACARIRDAGKRAGIWTAPFLVGSDSRLAREHRDWLLPGADAGWNWNEQLHALDVTNPDAAEHLEHVFRTLAGLGFDYFKLDFLYAGALAGIGAYKEGLRIIRRGAGPHATLLGCGAPLLPSIGLVDAMRIGPDVLAQPSHSSESSASSIAKARSASEARAWMNGRLWVNDPDCLVARPEVPERETWAPFVADYGGVVFSSDDLSRLDARGVELTLRACEGTITRRGGPCSFPCRLFKAVHSV